MGNANIMNYLSFNLIKVKFHVNVNFVTKKIELLMKLK